MKNILENIYDHSFSQIFNKYSIIQLSYPFHDGTVVCDSDRVKTWLSLTDPPDQIIVSFAEFLHLSYDLNQKGRQDKILKYLRIPQIIYLTSHHNSRKHLSNDFHVHS